MKGFFLFTVVIFVCFINHPTSWAYAPEDCIKCHDQGGRGSSLAISVKDFRASAHGKEMTCLDCHGGVKDEQHQTTPGSGIVNCTACHDQVNAHGLKGPSESRPQCYSCHTRHSILKKENEGSSVNPKRLKETCRGCHPMECDQKDFLSFLPSLTIASHSKQDFSQPAEKDDCLGCHQGQAAHGEQIPLTGQNCSLCHLPLKKQAPLVGYLHLKADKKIQPVSFVIAIFYMVALIFLVWGGFRFFINKFGRIKET